MITEFCSGQVRHEEWSQNNDTIIGPLQKLAKNAFTAKQLLNRTTKANFGDLISIIIFTVIRIRKNKNTKDTKMQ